MNRVFRTTCFNITCINYKNTKSLKLFSLVLLNQISISLPRKGKSVRNKKNSTFGCCHRFYVEVSCMLHWLLPAQKPKTN